MEPLSPSKEKTRLHYQGHLSRQRLGTSSTGRGRGRVPQDRAPGPSPRGSRAQLGAQAGTAEGPVAARLVQPKPTPSASRGRARARGHRGQEGGGAVAQGGQALPRLGHTRPPCSPTHERARVRVPLLSYPWATSERPHGRVADALPPGPTADFRGLLTSLSWGGRAAGMGLRLPMAPSLPCHQPGPPRGELDWKRGKAKGLHCSSGGKPARGWAGLSSAKTFGQQQIGRAELHALAVGEGGRAAPP